MAKEEPTLALLTALAAQYLDREEEKALGRRFPASRSEINDRCISPEHTEAGLRLATRVIAFVRGGADAAFTFDSALVTRAVEVQGWGFQRLGLSGVGGQRTFMPTAIADPEFTAFEQVLRDPALKLNPSQWPGCERAYLLRHAANGTSPSDPVISNRVTLLREECPNECLLFEAITVLDRLLMAERTWRGTGNGRPLHDFLVGKESEYRFLERLDRLRRDLPCFKDYFFSNDAMDDLRAWVEWYEQRRPGSRPEAIELPVDGGFKQIVLGVALAVIIVGLLFFLLVVR